MRYSSCFKCCVLLLTAVTAAAATVTWDGEAGNSNWHDPRNWSGDGVPGADDDVVIAMSSVSASSSVEIRGFLLSAGVSLSVRGTDTVFVANGDTVADGAGIGVAEGARLMLPGLISATRLSLSVRGGGTLRLPSLARYAAGSFNSEIDLRSEGNGSILDLPALTFLEGNTFGFFGILRLRADGSFNSEIDLRSEGNGSILDLPALTFLEGNTFGFFGVLRVHATQGGSARLQALVELAGGRTSFLSDGEGSLVDVSSLTTFANPAGASLTASEGGFIAIPADAKLTGVSVNGVTPGITFPVAPLITRQPLDQTVPMNSVAVFSVTAEGTEPIRYRWQFELTRDNWRDLEGETNSTLVISDATFARQGLYRCVVVNYGGLEITRAARLRIGDDPDPAPTLPFLVTQPSGVSAVAGQPVLLTVLAGGSSPLLYQWRKDGAILAGATAATLTIPAVQQGDAGTYTVVVSNEAGSVISDPAVLTVEPEPDVVLDIELFAGIWVTGVVGATYQIEFTDEAASGVWQALTTLTLEGATQLWIDRESAAHPKRYYRAVRLP